ncbi:hypothetical protein TD95_005300 [Thielaviopsis punctulata]|uniref:UBC core domain-containing protein n=1 Tax=Thielaviopsis punctulata TaxID=72032 RepID=A0A0F4ZGQ1_9PEZI|nr:hypothetical protein TD95_005300 [Thielaviopsis punctulata]
MAATKPARTRLTREYKSIQANPPPYIDAHPSESNILEWHYVITGPEDTPYHGGQYWGTLVFPPNYPFAPPAIRMHTPSGRFQTSTRLCLSISDFHPKSFNPAWEVSTILIGLLSFMTGDETTTGSLASTDLQKRQFAARTRWWNSTGGGSQDSPALKGNIKAGDGGAKFREQWPELHAQNLKWMEENNIDPLTGNVKSTGGAEASDPSGSSLSSCRPPLGIAGSAGNATANGSGRANQAQVVVDAVVQRRGAGQSWASQNKALIFGCFLFVYVLIARLLNAS